MGFRQIAIILGVILCLPRCKQNTVKSPSVNSSQIEVTSYLPVDSKGDSAFYYKYIKKVSGELAIESLDSGRDSIQIRFWFTCREREYRKIVVLKNDGKTWSARLIEYAAIHEGRDSIRVLNGGGRQLQSRGDWNDLIDTIIKLKLVNVPNMDEVPGMKMTSLEGKFFGLEILTKNAHRFVEYSNLGYYLDKNEYPASNVAKAFQLIISQFVRGCSLNEN